MNKIIVCLSGGLDSAVTLAYVRSHQPDAEYHTVAFRYGSKHNRHELFAAIRVAGHYGTKHRVIDLTSAFSDSKSDLMAGQGDIPEGHYQAESMKATVVPGRNTIFASVLLGYAQSIGAGHVVLGIHQGDHHVYPDCRPQWWSAMSEVYRTASEGKVALAAPFVSIDKVDIVRKGLVLKVPFEKTRTCYQDSELACGRCGSCTERLDAFSKNNATDPLPYQQPIV